MNRKISEYKQRCVIKGEPFVLFRLVYEDSDGLLFVNVRGRKVEVEKGRYNTYYEVGYPTFDLFEYANAMLANDDERRNKAWEAFGLGFRGSICDTCDRRYPCKARECDDEQGCIIDECNFYVGV